MIIIREIFEGANELFENELERALEIGCQTIVIEPCRLGEETARWIMVGNCLQKVSIVTGLGSIVSGCLLPAGPRAVAQYSLLATSLLSNVLYTLSWKSDPCSNYKVERSIKRMNEAIANKFADNVSVVTSTDLQSGDRSGEYYHRPGGVRYCKTSLPPVALFRRSNTEIRRNNLLTAAVSLLAIAFSMLNMFKETIKLTIF